MNIYSVPDLYDAIHKDSSFDIQLLKTIAKSRSGSVLELASGTGSCTCNIGNFRPDVNDICLACHTN